MPISWHNAPDVKKRLLFLIEKLGLSWLKTSKIIAFRSFNAHTKAYARIWGLGRVWQQALKLSPAYILEVISEKYDKLSSRQKDEVLLHELTHIPKNFSGSLVPHIRRGKGRFGNRLREIIAIYRNK